MWNSMLFIFFVFNLKYPFWKNYNKKMQKFIKVFQVDSSQILANSLKFLKMFQLCRVSC